MNHLRMSFATINRIVEERAQADAGYQAELEAAGRELLRDAKALDDDELKAELGEICGPIDRRRFAELTRGHDSAEDVADEIMARREVPLEPRSEDWLWFSIAILWERWQPDRPSFEMLDDWMQEGYQLVGDGQVPEACDLWLRVWRAFTSVCEKHRIDAVHDLDGRFRGSQSVFNWMQDLELELWNAGLENASYLRTRIDLCRDVVARFHDLGSLTASNMGCAIAESLAELGDAEAADAEYEALIRADAADDTLWTRWARSFERSNEARAADILERGLAVSGLRDRRVLLEAAVEMGSEVGRDELVRRARKELESSRPERGPVTARAPTRVGRNDPCPCGSGKKYKKCCLGGATA